jgi:hypothetical protein
VARNGDDQRAVQSKMDWFDNRSPADCSAADCTALFAGFAATMTESGRV